MLPSSGLSLHAPVCIVLTVLAVVEATYDRTARVPRRCYAEGVGDAVADAAVHSGAGRSRSADLRTRNLVALEKCGVHS